MIGYEMSYSLVGVYNAAKTSLMENFNMDGKLTWLPTCSGVHLKLRLGTTWVRNFDPAYVCTKKSSIFLKKTWSF